MAGIVSLVNRVRMLIAFKKDILTDLNVKSMQLASAV